MNEEQDQTKKAEISYRRKMRAMYVITAVLSITLVVTGVIFYIQLRFIQELVATAVDLIEAEVIREAPQEVDREEIEKTFDAIRKAVPKGKVNFGKARAAANYAQKARNDEQWTAKEVSALLHLMKVSLKIDKEE